MYQLFYNETSVLEAVVSTVSDMASSPLLSSILDSLLCAASTPLGMLWLHNSSLLEVCAAHGCVRVCERLVMQTGTVTQHPMLPLIMRCCSLPSGAEAVVSSKFESMLICWLLLLVLLRFDVVSGSLIPLLLERLTSLLASPDLAYDMSECAFG